MTDRLPLDTGTDDLIGWTEGRVAVLSFNRPGSRNALSDAMYAGFGRVLPALATRDDIGCVVVTGEGGAFCAGGDVKGFSRRNDEEAPKPGRGAGAALEPRIDGLRQLQRMVSLSLHEHPKFTVAALPGAAAGAGLSIALACDFRVATAKAVLTTAFTRIGASGDFGGSWFATQLVGASRAKELYALSERLTAADALAIGLVNRVFPDDTFADDWRAFAARLANGPQQAYRFVKENVNRAERGADLASALDAEAAAMVASMTSADHREAVRAFMEKREPRFGGA